ncbi:maturase K [Striga asiatica]|uniref:Maturase K n=1 Tax=Striga asiatica TaxID=4170 RepID=A0A5A7QZI0_STRAF|nr:maturase K [Striga asiatica]
MLGNLIINHLTEQISIQNAISTAINSCLNTCHQLRNLSSGKTLCLGSSFLDDIIIKSLDLYLLLPFKRSSSPGKGNSKTSSIRSAMAESRSLGRFVAKARTMSFDWSPVRNKKSFGRFYLLAQECICFINEEQQTPVGLLGPIKQLVYLRDSLRTQWRNITSRHQCIIKTL